jgi:hypothetical protein
MEEFEKLWESDNEEEVLKKEYLEEQTPEYQMIDGLAKYKLFSNFILLYFFVKYGETTDQDFFTQSTEIKFTLK